jgi:hypothetical protein
MSGAVPPLPQYAFTAWYLVKYKHRDKLPLPLPLHLTPGTSWIGGGWIDPGPSLDTVAIYIYKPFPVGNGNSVVQPVA